MKRLPTLLAAALLSLLPCTLVDAQAPGPPSDIISIRPLDRVVTAGGETIECRILDANPALGKDLKVKIRTVTTLLEAAKVKQIIPRRSESEAYENWAKWLRKEGRPGASLEAGDARASAEMALAIADAGADVILTGREEASLEKTAADIRALGREAFPMVADIGDPAACAPPASMPAATRVVVPYNSFFIAGTSPLNLSQLHTN